MHSPVDVIVAGAGPCGSIAAFELARRGIRVLILEKETFPRYKVCGGGLTPKVLREIPFDISGVIEREVYEISFTHNFGTPYTRRSSSPLMYCTMRDKLDQFLLNRALEAGAIIRFDEKVNGIETGQEEVKVQTTKDSYSCRFLLGADGASSVVARYAGFRQHLYQGMAMEAEINLPPGEVGRLGESVFLDWGTLPGGYAWMFPKHDHVSVGVGGPADLSAGLIPYYEKFLAMISLRQDQVRSKKFWPIPVRLSAGHFHAGRILVAGDAAGLTDPLTGEGIYYAVKSGAWAAEAISAELRDHTTGLNTYSRVISTRLISELKEADRVMWIFNTFPKRIHRLVRDNERVWGAFGKVLRGDRNYHDVSRGFGRLAFLWGLTCNIASFITRRKIRRYKREIRRTKSFQTQQS